MLCQASPTISSATRFKVRIIICLLLCERFDNGQVQRSLQCLLSLVHALLVFLTCPRINAAWAIDPNVDSVVRLRRVREAITLKCASATSPGVFTDLSLPTHLHARGTVPVD